MRRNSFGRTAKTWHDRIANLLASRIRRAQSSMLVKVSPFCALLSFFLLHLNEMQLTRNLSCDIAQWPGIRKKSISASKVRVTGEVCCSKKMKADNILTILHKSFKMRSKNATSLIFPSIWSSQNGVNGKSTEIFFKRYGRSQKPALVKCFTKRSGNRTAWWKKHGDFSVGSCWPAFIWFSDEIASLVIRNLIYTWPFRFYFVSSRRSRRRKDFFNDK